MFVIYLRFSFTVHPLSSALPPPTGIVKKGSTLSIICSINEDDWTSEQEHIGLTPPTCSAPDVTHSHPECASHPICHHSFSWIRIRGLVEIEWAAMEI